MPDVQQHYLEDADGLCTRLTRPVTKQGGSFGTVSLQEFKSGGWVISRQDLEIGEAIGKGDFGGELVWRSCYCCGMGWWVLLFGLFFGGWGWGGKEVVSRQVLQITGH